MFKAMYTGPARALVDEKGMVKRDQRNAKALEKGRTEQVSNKVVRAPGTIVCGLEMPTNKVISLDDNKNSDTIAVIQKYIKGAEHLEECSFSLEKIDVRKKAS